VKRVVIAVVTLAIVAVLFIAVFPTQALLAQRREHQAMAVQVARMTKNNDALEAQARKLKDDAEIERLAREQYNLVRPGEEAYALLPSAPPVQVAQPHVEGHTHAVRLPWWKRWWRSVASHF
jgi:cell division protein FtsB